VISKPDSPTILEAEALYQIGLIEEKKETI
jgi:hypothetical protein